MNKEKSATHQKQKNIAYDEIEGGYNWFVHSRKRLLHWLFFTPICATNEVQSPMDLQPWMHQSVALLGAFKT
jgi:hypothetical protein